MAKQVKKNQKQKINQPKKKWWTDYVFLPVILIVTLICFQNSLLNGFMASWDDNKYILDNPYIRRFDLSTIRYFFSHSYFANYHPLTMLSYCLEFKIFGLDPKPFHIHNLILHLINVSLVYIFIQKFLKKKEISIIVTALFALHPMHVESVAWLSERKDLLYSLFFLLSLIFYLNYLKNLSQLKFLIFSFLFFILSLCSKSAAAPLPLILLLIDYYNSRELLSKKVILEKIPFFAISILFGVIAIITQKNFGATNMAPSFPAYDRVFLISYAFVFYLIKFFVPVNLCSIYYYPIKVNGLLPLEYYISPLAILLIVFFIYKIISHRKIIITGMLFFVFMIGMVIQIIPLGRSITSDRYTYIPFIGISIIIGYFYIHLKNQYKKYVPYLTIILFFFIFYSCYAVIERCKVWHDGLTLCTDVAKKNPDQSHALAALAYAKMDNNDFYGAIEDYNKSLILKKDAESYNNRGNAKYKLKNYAAAIEDYTLAIKTDTNYSLAYYNKAAAIEQLAPDWNMSVKLYTKAIQCDKNYMLAYSSRGLAKYHLNDLNGAMEDCNKAIQLDTTYYVAYHNRGIIYFSLKQYQKAIQEYETTIRLKPDYDIAYSNRGVAKYYLNDKQGACMDWQFAVNKGNKEAEAYLRDFCK